MEFEQACGSESWETYFLLRQGLSPVLQILQVSLTICYHHLFARAAGCPEGEDVKAPL